MIFVNSMSDLFHPDVSFEFIEDLFSRIIKCKQHTYQLLTKRIDRALEYYAWYGDKHNECWPIPNIRFGASICTQSEANENIPLLCEIPAAYRFISFVPLLAPVNFFGHDGSAMHDFWQAILMDTNKGIGSYIHQIVIGCERKHGQYAGRFQDGFVEAAKDLIRQADESGVKVFVKQIPCDGMVVTDIEKFPKELRRIER